MSGRTIDVANPTITVVTSGLDRTVFDSFRIACRLGLKQLDNRLDVVDGPSGTNDAFGVVLYPEMQCLTEVYTIIRNAKHEAIARSTFTTSYQPNVGLTTF